MKVLSIILAIALFLTGCGGVSKNQTVPTFREQAIKHHYQLKVALEDTYDGQVDQPTIDSLEETLNWIKSYDQEKMSDEDQKILSMMTKCGLAMTNMVNAILDKDKNKYREQTIAYVFSSAMLERLLNLNE